MKVDIAGLSDGFDVEMRPETEEDVKILEKLKGALKSMGGAGGTFGAFQTVITYSAVKDGAVGFAVKKR